MAYSAPEHPQVGSVRELSLLLFLSAALLLSNQSVLPINGDEVVYAPAVKRMLESGNWMTVYQFLPPALESESPVGRRLIPDVFLDDVRGHVDPDSGMAPLWSKTPLTFWTMGVSVALFGENEFAIRLPSTLFAIGTVALVYALTQMLTGSSAAGFWAGLVLTMSQPFLILGQSGTTDATCIFFSMLALWGYFRALHGHRREAVLIGLGVGLAFMAKPFIPLLVFPICALDMLATRRLAVVMNPYVWVGLAIGVLVNVPWFAYEYHVFGMDFVRGFWQVTLGTGIGERFVYPDGFFFRNHPLYYVRYLLVFYLPWALIVPIAIWQCRREQPDVAWCATISLAVVLTSFSVAATRFPQYVSLLYPVLAIPVGYYLKLLQDRITLPRAIVATMLTLLAVRTVYLGYALTQGPAPVPRIPFGARWWAALTITLGLAALLSRVPKSRPGLRVVLPMAGLYLTFLSAMLSYWVVAAPLPVYRGVKELDPSIRTVVQRNGSTAPIAGVAVGPRPLMTGGLYWYFGQFPSTSNLDSIDHFLRKETRAVFIVTDETGAAAVQRTIPEAIIRKTFVDENRILYLFERTGDL